MKAPGRICATPGVTLGSNGKFSAWPSSLDDVKRIAQLARLEFSEAEAEQVAGAAARRISRSIEELQSVDTRGIEPMSHAQDVSLRLREDRVTEARPARAASRAIAPQVDAGLYLVPKVIE